jgi:PAS domain S-box-containing protein
VPETQPSSSPEERARVGEATAPFRIQEPVGILSQPVRDLADAVSDIVLLVDLSGRILHANRWAVELTGRTRDELKDSSLTGDWILEEDQPRLKKALDDCHRCQAGGVTVGWRNVSGEVRHLDGVITPITLPTGDSQLAWCIFHHPRGPHGDGLIRKADQAQVAHTLRLTEVGKIAAGLTHDLSEPITTICSYTEGALRKLQRGTCSSAELIAIFEELASAASQAADVTRSLRRFVRKGGPKLTSTDINETIHNAVRLLQFALKNRQVRLRLELADQLPSVLIDAAEIQQCIINFFRNALDSMEHSHPDQREVTLVSKLSDNGDILVAVRDRGEGLTEEVCQRLFEPFFTTKEDGVGLGLELVRQVVKSHGGETGAHGNTDGGATFWFTLPRQHEGNPAYGDGGRGLPDR